MPLHVLFNSFIQYIRVESINAFQFKLVTVSPYTPQILVNENTVLCLYHVPQLVTSVAVKKIQYMKFGLIGLSQMFCAGFNYGEVLE